MLFDFTDNIKNPWEIIKYGELHNIVSYTNLLVSKIRQFLEYFVSILTYNVLNI